MARVYAESEGRPGEVPQAKADEIVINNHHHGFIIGEAAGVQFNTRCDQVIARVVDNELLGGVVYSGYTGHSIAMHVAGFDPRWISRDLIWTCFDYPFSQLQVKKIFAPTPSSNKLAHDMNLRWGFTRPVIVEDVFEDGDLIVLSMYAHECRWLKLKPNRIARGG